MNFVINTGFQKVLDNIPMQPETMSKGNMKATHVREVQENIIQTQIITQFQKMLLDRLQYM